jgi:hypothetical protein
MLLAYLPGLLNPEDGGNVLSSEMLLDLYQITRHHIQEDGILNACPAYSEVASFALAGSCDCHTAV